MIKEIDIYRAASVMIGQYGGEAVLMAMNRVEGYRRIGNSKGMDVWRRIGDAIETLQIAPDLSTQTCH